MNQIRAFNIILRWTLLAVVSTALLEWWSGVSTDDSTNLKLLFGLLAVFSYGFITGYQSKGDNNDPR